MNFCYNFPDFSCAALLISLPHRKAYGFYDDINTLLDFYINLVPAEAREGGKKLLPEKKAGLPNFLFKERAAIMQEKVSISK